MQNRSRRGRYRPVRNARVLNIVLLACVALGDPRPPPPARLEVLEGRVSIEHIQTEIGAPDTSARRTFRISAHLLVPDALGNDEFDFMSAGR